MADQSVNSNLIVEGVSTPDASRNRSQVRSAARAFQLLDALASSPTDETSLDELAHRTELPRSTTHRLLVSLVRQEYVERGNARGSYRLGLRMAILGYHAVRGRRPSEVTQALLEQGSTDLGLALTLAVLDGTHVVAVSRGVHEGVPDSGIAFGSSVPAHACAAGKILLSAQSPTRLSRTYSAPELLRPFTPNTIRSLSALLAAVDRARARGYALDDEEWTEGLRCVSVPVIQGRDRITYALTASGPSAHLQRADVPGIHSHLVRLARRLPVISGPSGPS